MEGIELFECVFRCVYVFLGFLGGIAILPWPLFWRLWGWHDHFDGPWEAGKMEGQFLGKVGDVGKDFEEVGAIGGNVPRIGFVSEMEELGFEGDEGDFCLGMCGEF